MKAGSAASDATGHGILLPMITTIDRGGRVVVPKGMRDQLGLAPGATVEVVLLDGAVVVRPAGPAMRLAKRGAGVVAQPEGRLPALTAAAVREALESTRR